MIDVEKIKEWVDGDDINIMVATVHIRRLLETIPADKSSARYALWLLSQGKKICKAEWNHAAHICSTNSGLRWPSGYRTNHDLICDDGRTWLEWTPPAPPVDMDELNRKCREICREAFRSGLFYTESSRVLTDAERAALLEEKP